MNKAYAEIHKTLELPYRDSPLLTNLLNEGFTAELIIGVMKERYKPSVKRFSYYEGAIRDTAEETNASRRSRKGNGYYEPPSEREAQQAARMAKMQTDVYGAYEPAFDIGSD